jgi:hypothetical protein
MNYIGKKFNKIDRIENYIRRYLSIYSYPLNEPTINELIKIVKCYDINQFSLENSKLFKRALRVLMRCNFAEAIVETGIKSTIYNYVDII